MIRLHLTQSARSIARHDLTALSCRPTVRDLMGALALLVAISCPSGAEAQDYIDLWPVCEAARIPPERCIRDENDVYETVNQAVAIAEACRHGQAACPVPRPDPNVVYELVAQTYATAEACLAGAPDCPAPLPPPPGDPDPVYSAVNQALALAQACIAQEPDCSVPPDLGPVGQLVAQVYIAAQACLNGAPECPAPAPASAPQGIGLGGYRYCVTSDFALSGSGLGTVTPLLQTQYDVTGSASAQCTKDASGQSGWVNVTLTFQGTEDGSLPCTAWGTGDYRIVGSLWLSDGSVNVEAPAALGITVSYVDQSVAVNFDLADNNMRSSLQVFDVYPAVGATPPLPPIVVPGSNACFESAIQELHASGSLDLLPSAISVAAAHTGLEDADLASGYSIKPPQEVIDKLPGPVRERVQEEYAAQPPDEVKPNLPRFSPDGVSQVQEIDKALAQTLGTLMALIGDAVTPELAVPGTNVRIKLLPDKLPYMVRVTYRLSSGATGTVEMLGAPGVPTRVFAPNGNNSNIPEYVEVNVSLDTVGGRYSMGIDRQPDACAPFPIDVRIIAPPAEQVQDIAGIKAEVGYDGLSVGGGAPKTYRLGLTQTSSNDFESNSVTVRMTHCTGTGLPVDVVGRYANQADKDDLTLRMHMVNPVTDLGLTSTTESKKRTLAYRANRAITSIALTGLENGFEFNARLDDVAPTMDICSDAGTSCLLPSRVYQCGCDAYYSGSRRFFRICMKPRYCPIPVETSLRMTSTNRTGGY